ncbi:hypothetical protein HW115_05855 [Verrucomicrobiaceae bacterium N1E253]|uniref:Uncharacterized protein n=1 Tax=Oceaniferula marina TaxID=2748318 RepID=A0A851GIV0_9BACT|nr:hypothetical protein [Oceaniferula marina]NWK55125.1 hypothetical protein [Oceaniferula marina]
MESSFSGVAFRDDVGQNVGETMEADESWSGKVRRAVLPSGPKKLAEPEKELRFTRAAQAPLFYAASVVFFALSVALFILSTQDWGMKGPFLDGWWWTCIPCLLVSYGLLRIGLRCTRHAYLIVSPLGVEIFPFFKPQKNLQILYWTEIADAECTPGAKQLIFHFTEKKNSGVVVSLHPIPASRRHLLEEAVLGVIEQREQQAACNA